MGEETPLPRTRFASDSLPLQGQTTHFSRPPSTQVGVSTKKRPHLVGHLVPKRNRFAEHTATFTRGQSVGHSSIPIPSNSFTPVSNESPSPVPSQSSTPVPDQPAAPVQNQGSTLDASQSSNPPPSQSTSQNDGASTPPSELSSVRSFLIYLQLDREDNWEFSFLRKLGGLRAINGRLAEKV